MSRPASLLVTGVTGHVLLSDPSLGELRICSSLTGLRLVD